MQVLAAPKSRDLSILMLSPKQQKYADRLRELIGEGQHLLEKDVKSPEIGSPYVANPIDVTAWHAKTINILEAVFGSESTQRKHYDLLTSGYNQSNYISTISNVTGLLTGALNDLENGFLQGQEFLITAEVLDSFLEQAKHLNDAGYKDPAAVLGRAVLEDALKRLAREESIATEKKKATLINQELKTKDRYSQAQWRRVDAMLDVGNASAHDEFEKYGHKEVAGMIDEIEKFLATHFNA